MPRSDLDVIVFDFDGVLTGNRVLVFDDGREAVCCNRADGLAFDALRREGLPAWILSTETNPVATARARKLHVPVMQGLANKAAALVRLCETNGYSLARTVYVGNDVNDLGAMKLAGYPIAVADAHQAIKDVAWRVLMTRGGDGIAREIVEHTLSFDVAASAAGAVAGTAT